VGSCRPQVFAIAGKGNPRLLSGIPKLLQPGQTGERRRCRIEVQGHVSALGSTSDNRVLERSDARVFLGHALFLQHRYSESIPLYEKAVEIRRPYEHSDRDADFASENASLARAYAAVGDLSRSDTYYAQAVVIFKAAIANLPEMKSNYAARLKSTLIEYAKLKAGLGQEEESARLEKEASEL